MKCGKDIDGGKEKEMSLTNSLFFCSSLANSSNVAGHVQHIKGQVTCIILT
jgi:hypothetical protein